MLYELVYCSWAQLICNETRKMVRTTNIRYTLWLNTELWYMRIGVFLLLFITSCFTSVVKAQSRHEIIQASYIQKFAKYTKWPTQKMIQKEFVIGVVGDEIFAEHLMNIYKKTYIKKRKVVVLNITSYTELDVVHVLYIAQVKRSELEQIIGVAAEYSILTVSFHKGRARQGVCINFYKNSLNKLRFEINQDSILASKLKVDALFLDYAKFVN